MRTLNPSLILTFLLFCSNVFGQEIKVKPENIVMDIGESVQLSSQVLDEDGSVIPGRIIRYFSLSSRGVSVVDSTGLLTAHKHGSHRVIAYSPKERQGYLRKEIEITVNPAPIARIVIEEVPDRNYEGVIFPLDMKVYDEAGFDREDVTVELKSSNDGVARVLPFHRILASGKGKATITAIVEGVEGTININVVSNPISSINLSSDRIEGRTGDVFYLKAVAADINGNQVSDAPIKYSFVGQSYNVSASPSALVTDDGRFVASDPGLYTINATCGPAAASITISATLREVSRKIEVVGQGSVTEKRTSDLWIWEGVDGRDYAVTGTWGADGTAYFWDVTNPVSMELVDSIQVDARTVNDVKVSEDGTVCIISREGASNRKNGLVILDVTDPRDVQIHAEFNDRLTGGVHNIFIDKGYVYALSAGRKFYTVSIKDPKNPEIVGEFELDTPGHSIHDVWIVDGIAYSSNWDDGVQLIDVGNGIAGGTPEKPVQFASYTYPSGSNHAAFPYQDKVTGKFYVIAGDEEFPYEMKEGIPEMAAGFLHVIDFSDLENPKEVAWFEVPFAGSHNFWIEDDILYAAFYNGGIRVIDLSGELLGDLHHQGREIAWILPYDPEGFIPNAPFVWGAQPYKGHIFYADHNSGLWAAKLEPVIPEDTEIDVR